MVKNQFIGIIDSGIGGFSVVRAMRCYLSGENIVYIADPLYFPYGFKTPGELLRIVHPFFSYFSQEDGIKAVITACGTVSSSCLPELRKHFQFPIIGIVEPGAEEAARMTRNGIVAVLATKATVRSSLFKRCIVEHSPSVQVIEEAWPEYIEAVERGEYRSTEHVIKVRRELEKLINKGVDVLVMGCTHFSLISDYFEKLTDGRVKIVDPAVAAVKTLKMSLQKNNMILNGKGELHVLVRGDSSSFQRALASFPGLGYHRVGCFQEKEFADITSSKIYKSNKVLG